MATINLGRIGFVNKGDYNALTAYKVNDIVKYTSGTYACKLAHTGQVPTETTYWQEWVDDNAVHKTGDETVAGTKTFSSPIKLSNSGFTATLQSGTLSGDVVHTLPSTSSNLASEGFVIDNAGISLVTANSYDLGVGQTWQNVTANRVKGTAYTNTTGKPISISIYASSSSDTNGTISVDGVSAFLGANGFVGNYRCIVPNNATYSLLIGTGTLYSWLELR